MESKHIAIIGGGPVGIEAALYGRALGHEIMLFERGQIAENVRNWGFVTLFSPWEMNTTPLGWRMLKQAGRVERPNPKICPTGHELRERYLLPLSELKTLKGLLRPRSTVISIGRNDYWRTDEIGKSARAGSPFRILLHDEQGRERIERADVVLDCSGTYGRHRWAGRGGIPARGEQAMRERIWFTIPDVLGRDRERFAGRYTLLLGCGYSAAAVLQNLERLTRDHPRTKVTWAIRRQGQALQAIENDPLGGRAGLIRSSLKLIESPPTWLQFLDDCVLESIEGDGSVGVTLKSGRTELAMIVDEVVAMVGYKPDSSIHEQLQVHQCYATAGPIKLAAALLGEKGSDCLTAGASVDARTLQNPEPNFFIIGAKSYGTNSNFLIQIGHKQIRDVYRLLAADADLDLYQIS